MVCELSSIMAAMVHLLKLHADHQDVGPQTVEDAEERLCVICLVNERDTTVLPCRHMCMCHDCAQELRRQTSKCPICRNHVESLLHIKMQKGANPSGSSGNPGPASAVPSAN